MKLYYGILPLALASFAQVATAQSYSYEAYIGGAFDFTSDGLEYGSIDYPMENGGTLGFGVYTDRFGGVELGVDLMATDRQYEGFETHLQSLSLMAVGRYPFASFSSGEAYAGAGLGAIRVRYDGKDQFPTYTGHEIVGGGQLSLGARFAAGSGQVFTELKYQAAFDMVEIVGADIEYNSTSLVVGYRF